MTVRYARKSADVAPVNKNNTNALGFYLEHGPVAEPVKLWYPYLDRLCKTIVPVSVAKTKEFISTMERSKNEGNLPHHLHRRRYCPCRWTGTCRRRRRKRSDTV